MASGLFPPRLSSCMLPLLVFVLAGLTGVAPGQTPNLSFFNNYFVRGDHVARNFVSSGSSTTLNGTTYANGTITIPSSGSGDPEGMPSDAEIVVAFLYWQVLEPMAPPSPPLDGSSALFNGYSVTGDPVGIDHSACPGSETTFVRSYRANVLPYLPVVNGISQAAATHTVGLPPNPNGSPSSPGASLVIVYRILRADFPLKATVIYEGNALVGPPPITLDLPIRGFYDAVASDGSQVGYAKITDIFGATINNGTITLSAPSSYTWPQAVADDAAVVTSRSGSYSYVWQLGQCDYVWTAVVFSTLVKNSDDDGLPDAWKKGPAAGDPNAGAAGYYNVRDGSWVALPGAQQGHKDIFIQYDWMSGDNGHTHQPPQPQDASKDPLKVVSGAFAKQNIYLHFVFGNMIHEDTCTDDTSQSPPLLCMFPGEPGVIAWKLGLEAIKAWPADMTSCAGGGDCTPRFAIGRKDSYHYLLFGHSVALPTWSTLANTLVSIKVSSGTATVTTSAPITSCPSRVTIDGALATPNLNGVYGAPYNVIECPPASPTTFSIPSINMNKTAGYTVDDGTYPNTLPEPYLAVYTSQTDSTSGYSDVGGGDIVMTLGKWTNWTWNFQPNHSTAGECYSWDATLASSCVNGLAGTLMHELGHNLGLLHGGRYPTEVVASGVEPNCKPNYQSVMNYLFQVDLLQDSLGNSVPDYSGQTLDSVDENSLSMSAGLTPAATYPYTKWYIPVPPGSGASSHCDGTPIGPNEHAMSVVGPRPANPISWSNGWDINFDGGLSVLHGYYDWLEIDPLQIGASGNDYANGFIYNIDSQIGYQFPIGNYAFGPGGGLRAGGGGGLRAGGGGGLRAGGGGGLRAGGGGGLRAGGGGGLRAGGGGGLGEANYPTMDSYPRPPLALTEPSSGVLTWKPASFGTVLQYNIYRMNGATITLIGCVVLDSASPPPNVNPPSFPGCPPYNPMHGNPYADTYSYTDSGAPPNSTYLVRTVDLDPVSSQPRESTPQGIGAFQAPLLVNVTTPLTYNSSETLTVSGGSSNGAVTYYLLSGPCSLSGNQLTAKDGTSSCVVTATMAGDSTYEPVTSAAVTVTLQKANANITVTPYTVAYDGGAHTAIGTATGVKGEDLSGLLNLRGTTHTAVGTYAADSWSFTGDNNYNSASGGPITDIISSWTASGFYPPVVTTPNGTAPIWNDIKGGRTVPLKFNIYAGNVQRTRTLDVKGQSIAVYAVQCNNGTETNNIDLLVDTGDTALRYDGSQFIQNWKTPQGANHCYVAIMTAADNVTILQAYFKAK